MVDPAFSTFDSFPSTSSQLLLESLRGDQDAWEQLTALYGRLVYRWLRNWGVNAADASDVMQETFLAVYRGLATYDRQRAPFRAWLFVVTRHAAISFWRRQRDEPVGEGGTTAWQRQLELAAPDESTDVADLIPTEIIRSALEYWRSRRSDRTWEVVSRVVLDGIPPDVVADQMGLTVAAVYTAKCRVLAFLRHQLRDWEG